MQIQPDDPLNALVSEDAASINREQLANFLVNYVVFDKSDKSIHFLPRYQSLASNSTKIEVLLLATKARHLLFGIDDGLLPKEIIDIGVLAPGSVKSSLKALFDGRKIAKRDGKYILPQHRVNEVISNIGNKEGS